MSQHDQDERNRAAARAIQPPTPTPPSAKRVEDIRQLHAQEIESPLLGDNAHYDEIGTLLDHIDVLQAQLREREREVMLEGKRGDRREAEMAEQRDLAYAKYDETRQEMERLREALAKHTCPIMTGQGSVWCAEHKVYHRSDIDEALRTRRPAPETA